VNLFYPEVLVVARQTSICTTALKGRCFLAVAFDTIPP
jgi:hypothetical protein